MSQIRDLVDAHATPEQMTSRTGLWKKFFTIPIYSQLFEPPTDIEAWPYTLPATLEIVTERALSKSPLAVQNDEVKKKAEETVKEIVEKGDGLKWIDQEKGVFEYPYKTQVVVIKQKGN